MDLVSDTVRSLCNHKLDISEYDERAIKQAFPGSTIPLDVLSNATGVPGLERWLERPNFYSLDSAAIRAKVAAPSQQERPTVQRQERPTVQRASSKLWSAGHPAAAAHPGGAHLPVGRPDGPPIGSYSTHYSPRATLTWSILTWWMLASCLCEQGQGRYKRQMWLPAAGRQISKHYLPPLCYMARSRPLKVVAASNVSITYIPFPTAFHNRLPNLSSLSILQAGAVKGPERTMLPYETEPSDDIW